MKSAIPPTMIPAPIGAHLSRSSTTSSGGYFSRSSRGSSATSYSHGSSRSSSLCYKKTGSNTRRAFLDKRASTGSHYLLSRKTAESGSVHDAGYESDLEGKTAFDSVDALKTRFIKSPKTPATLRALKIIEERTGISRSTCDPDNNITGYPREEEIKESVEDWSDDYEIPEAEERIIRSEPSKHISTFPSEAIDASLEQAIEEGMKYEPLIAPLDAALGITDSFYSQGGFTRDISMENDDKSLEIDEIMAQHAQADVGQLMGKVDNLDFSTTSFQVWRDVASSSFESLSSVKDTDALMAGLARAPFRPKSIVRSPSRLRNQINVSEEGIDVEVPEIILHDATDGSVDLAVLPGQIFDIFPSGSSLLHIWADSASFVTALEGESDEDLIDIGGPIELPFVEVEGQINGYLEAEILPSISSPPIPSAPAILPSSDSGLKSCTESLRLDGSPSTTHGSSPEHTDESLTTSTSPPVSMYVLSPMHNQLEATDMVSPMIYSESFSFGGGNILGSPIHSISGLMFSARGPLVQQQTLTGEDLDVATILRLEVAVSRLPSHNTAIFAAPSAATATALQESTPAGRGVGLGMNILPYPPVDLDLPSIDSMVSLPDFYEFSNSVPAIFLEHPSPTSLGDSEDMEDFDFEHGGLSILPPPIPEISPEQARGWSCTVEVYSNFPSPTIIHACPDTIPGPTVLRPSTVTGETSLMQGEFYSLDNVAGSHITDNLEEKDIILPAPLLVRHVPISPRHNHISLPADARVVDGVFKSTSVGLGLVGLVDATVDSPVSLSQPVSPSHPVVAVQTTAIKAKGEELEHRLLQSTISVFPNVNTQDVDEATKTDISEDAAQRDPGYIASLDKQRANGRISAIERWRDTCSKADMYSSTVEVDAAVGSSAQFEDRHMPAYLSHTFMSTPSCTPGNVPSTGRLPVRRNSTGGPVRSGEKFRLYKRRSTKVRMSPRSSSLSKASELRSYTLRERLNSSDDNPLLSLPASIFVERFESSVDILDRNLPRPFTTETSADPQLRGESTPATVLAGGSPRSESRGSVLWDSLKKSVFTKPRDIVKDSVQSTTHQGQATGSGKDVAASASPPRCPASLIRLETTTPTPSPPIKSSEHKRRSWFRSAVRSPSSATSTPRDPSQSRTCSPTMYAPTPPAIDQRTSPAKDIKSFFTRIPFSRSRSGPSTAPSLGTNTHIHHPQAIPVPTATPAKEKGRRFGAVVRKLQRLF